MKITSISQFFFIETIEITQEDSSSGCQLSVYRLDSIISRIVNRIHSWLHGGSIEVRDSLSSRCFDLLPEQFEKLISHVDKKLHHSDWIHHALQTWRARTEKKPPADFQTTVDDFFTTATSVVPPTDFTISFDNVESITLEEMVDGSYYTVVCLTDGRKGASFLRKSEVRKLYSEESRVNEMPSKARLTGDSLKRGYKAQEVLQDFRFVLARPNYLMDIETQVRLHQDAPMLSIWEHGSTDFSSREMRVTKRSHLRDKHSIHERCLLHSRIHAFKGMLVAAAPVEDYIQKIYYFFPKKIELIKNSGFDDGLLQLAIKEGKFTLLYKVCLLISEGGLNPDDPVAFFHVLIENEQQKQNLEDDFEKRSQKLTERRLGEARAFTANSRREELTYMTIGEYERFVKAGMKRRIGFLGISEVWNEIKPQLTPQLTRIIREGRCREMIENVKILQKLKTYGIVTGYDNSHLIGNLLWDVDTVAHIQEKIEAHKAVLLENWKREKKVLYSLSSMFVPKDKLEGIDREIESAIKLLDYLKKFKASFPLLAEGLEDAVILDGRAAESRLAQILKDSRVNQGVKSAASTITP